jgi:hypothetical protein
MCYLQSVSRIAISAAIACLLFSAAAQAEDRALELKELEVYSIKDGTDSQDRSFDSMLADELGLYALIRIAGLEDRRQENLDLYLVLFDEDDDERNHPLLKQKRTERFGNGEFVLEFPDFMNADDWFGDYDFVAVLEASMKGAKTVRMEREFRIEGPRMPGVSFENLAVFSYERGPDYDELTPGEEFVIDVTVRVEENDSGLDPRLRLFAVMEDDLWYIDPEEADLVPSPNWSEAWLRGGAGEWRVLARGRMPSYFEHPFDYRHDYRVYAFVSFGDNPGREMDFIRLTLYDPDNGELRESADITQRLILLGNAGQWSISQTKKFEKDED